MLSNVVIIAAVVAVLLIGLILYGRHAKDQTPMMGKGCHGDCDHCVLNCEEEKKKD